MRSILLTNDDGPMSAPFAALLVQLSKENDVRTVIPSNERSWIGKSITQGIIPPTSSADVLGYEILLVDGTPADCVQLGMHNILKERPEMVVSGMNIGENVGVGRMLSSGTLGGAFEAAIAGTRAVSVSVVIPREVRGRIDVRDPNSHEHFQGPAEISAKLVSRLMDLPRWDGFQVVSINIPLGADPETEVEITRPSMSTYGRLFQGEEIGFVHSNPLLEDEDMENGTDSLAVTGGRVSVTPISIEMTNEGAIEELERFLRGV